MAENRTGELALQSLCAMVNAFSTLEVGDIGVVKFGEDVDIMHRIQQGQRCESMLSS